MNNSENHNERVKNALCYIPIVAFVLFFIEENKTPDLDRNIKYGMIFFWVYFILTLIISWLFTGLLFLVYIWISIYFGYKAYNGEDIKVEFIDNLLEKNTNKSNKEKKD